MLRKLWSSLLGGSAEPVAIPDSGNAPAAASRSTPADVVTRQNSAESKASGVVLKSKLPAATAEGTARKTIAKSARQVQTGVVSIPPNATPKPVVASSRQVLSLASHGEHDGLVRSLAKELSRRSCPTTILEIGIGDGSRTASILSGLSTQVDAQTIKYVVIEEFEMAGNPTTLRDFHSRLRGISLRPQIIPQPIQTALVTTLHRFGFADIVIIDPAVNTNHVTNWSGLMKKVSRDSSVVFSKVGGVWSTSPSQAISRAA